MLATGEPGALPTGDTAGVLLSGFAAAIESCKTEERPFTTRVGGGTADSRVTADGAAAGGIIGTTMSRENTV